MPDNPEKTLQELRQRISTEGLPELSARHCACTTARSGVAPGWPSRLRPSPRSACPRKHSDCSTRKLIRHGRGNGGNWLSWHHAIFKRALNQGGGERIA